MIIRVAIAILAFLVILRVGMILLRGLAAPLPPPPPPGDLRRVNLTYRCNQCGAEIRMTRAASEDPMPPRHCMDEMDLIKRGDE